MRIHRALLLGLALLTLAVAAPLPSPATSGFLHIYIYDFDYQVTLNAASVNLGTSAGSGMLELYPTTSDMPISQAQAELFCVKATTAGTIARTVAAGVSLPVVKESGEITEARFFRVDLRHDTSKRTGSFGLQEVDASTASAGCDGWQLPQRIANASLYEWIGV